MNYAATQAAVDYRADRLKRRQDDRDAADAALEDRISREVVRIVGRVASDPAYCARIVSEAEIPLHELRVRLHGESMTWLRAALGLRMRPAAHTASMRRMRISPVIASTPTSQKCAPKVDC